MPNIKSAKKRVIITQKKNEQNRSHLSEMKNAIKKFNNAIDTNNIDEADKLLPVTMSIIDSCVSKGVIHKNQAANKKSAISKRLSAVKSGKLVITIKKDNKTIAAEKAKAAQEARAKEKAEFERKAAEKKAAKIEAEKAKLEAEKATKKPAKTKKVKEEDAVEEKPKKRTTKKAEETTQETPAQVDEPATEEKPKKRTTKKATEKAE